MSTGNTFSIKALSLSLIALLALLTVACTKPATPGVKKMPANQ